jgi:hypothetical protein
MGRDGFRCRGYVKATQGNLKGKATTGPLYPTRALYEPPHKTRHCRTRRADMEEVTPLTEEPHQSTGD